MTEAPRDFLDVLIDRATNSPDRPAFRLAGEDGTSEMSYGGLGNRVRRLGSALRHVGHGAGERIAVCMENRPAWPVAYMATWYAGAVVVPIDPALEPHAIRRVLEHSMAVAVMTSHALGPKILSACEGLDRRPVVYDVDAIGDRRWDGEPAGQGVEPATGESCGRAWDEIKPGDQHGDWSPSPMESELATIMYTSGTTGLPKGVMLSRQALARNIATAVQRIELNADTHVLGVLPLFHVLPLMANCLGPIYVGAQVTFLTELNPDRIIAAFPRFGITAFACVPLFFYRFHDRVMKRLASLSPMRRRIANGLLRLSRFARRRLGLNIGKRLFAAAHEPFGSGLRLFVTGGAKFNERVYEDFLDLGFPLVQGYGLTEATAVLTAHPANALRADTVGPPVSGVELRIEGAGDGGVGEILAHTPSRMLGYYRNQEATDEILDGEWLRTGDLGRIDAEGHLQVTGRAKDMIVLASGKNIYPEELEVYYGESEFIQEICILGIDDPSRRGAERLHAVVVPDVEAARRKGHVNIREMVKWEIESLAIDLPGPQRVTSLEIRTEPLPRTSTRKVKRFELKREVLARGIDGADGQAPPPAARPRPEPDQDEEPAWAHQVRAIVARQAGVEGVARGDHLDLDLGLESLDRVELQAEIEEAMAVELPREAGAEVQTVGDLLDLVGQQASPGQGAGEASRDRWARVLAEPAPELDSYLRSRRVGENLLYVAFALARLLLWPWGRVVRGLENLPAEGAYILAPNHASFVDPFLLTAALRKPVFHRIFFVGYSGYFRGSLLGALARLLRTVPIDQNRHLERAMQAAAEGLRRGLVLGIFPEGGRTSDGAIKPFRRGTGILARNLAVPVVPVGLGGTYQMWPREGRFRPHRTAVVFGRPMRVRPGADRDAEVEFMSALRERVIESAASAHRLAEKN